MNHLSAQAFNVRHSAAHSPLSLVRETGRGRGCANASMSSHPLPNPLPPAGEGAAGKLRALNAHYRSAANTPLSLARERGWGRGCASANMSNHPLPSPLPPAGEGAFEPVITPLP